MSFSASTGICKTNTDIEGVPLRGQIHLHVTILKVIIAINIMQTINVNTNSQVYVDKQGTDMTDLNNKLMGNDNFVNIPS